MQISDSPSAPVAQPASGSSGSNEPAEPGGGAVPAAGSVVSPSEPEPRPEQEPPVAPRPKAAGQTPNSQPVPPRGEGQDDVARVPDPKAHLAEYFRRHSKAQLDSLRRGVQSRLREQEVSYNLLGAPDFSIRPWQLDELPHLLSATEFEGLARVIARRAQLLEACLSDVYGPQRLIREGVIPADLVFGNPHFFRSLHGITPVNQRRLVLYAVDVGKTLDGRYVVYSDRTSAPTGSGYALENRLAIGQLLSEPFRTYRTRKINRFFEVMRQALRELSPRDHGLPRVVLLTPGIFDESSFEHAYLARYQGIQLVEGRDLTVRGEEVFLKTLGGLERVDVILRRVPDGLCDPLELREDSHLGVAGLVLAARAGRVGIANPLGSGLIESPAFRAYLPEMSRALFGEPLGIESIPTRHLGNRLHREEVMDSLDQWVIRPAFGDRRKPPQHVARLTPSGRAGLEASIAAAPARLVAEKWPQMERVPVGLDYARDGAFTLRMFACATGSDYFVMPGGLGRVDGSPDGLFLSHEDASISKDVWVVGDEGAQIPTPPRMPDEELSIRRGGVDLPSRLFDDIFWLGRYVERSYGTARLSRAGLEPLASEDRELPAVLTDALMRTLVSLQILTPGSDAAPQFERALLAAVYDGTRPNSIRSCLRRVGDLTTATRSRLSQDAWRVLRQLTRILQPADGRELIADEAVDQLDELLLGLAAFYGITSSNMVRGQAWIFLEMGRRLEHSVFVLTLLGQLFRKPGSRILMETLLIICDSLLTYRSRYLSALQAAPVVDLVLTDDTNPQSVLFQLRRLLECVRSLPRERAFPLSRAEQRLITLQARLETADLYLACRGDAADLRGLVEDGVNLLWQVSDDLTQTYFAHATKEYAIGAANTLAQEGEGL